MSADQLIAEIKALSVTERQQVINAVLSDEVARLPETPATEENFDFVEHWKGRFSLPESNPGDARLTYLLDRFFS
jgi:hypothetical protein